ncbi:hypothetical protein [Colwellia sp. C1TZA3]|uniref:hypothetical protein n=1 Tax=Colwellia sp. C1TZA3 TaxID=2508879 RepID=UPI0011BA368C|nr:hypothetical protein [Colwellia sp. C1TZA3]TWX69271.1 hypothetical protein ESZ39_11535 [Colwellia sp. C1TZA3]
MTIKWLVITLFTLTCFMVILLGLGYFLSENEKATMPAKHALAQQTQLQQKKPLLRKSITNVAKPETDANIMNNFENTLINNLTCITLAQCQVVTVKFKNVDCKLASNVIGASQLKKIATQRINMETCPTVNPQSQLACQQNICTLMNTLN